MLLKKIMLSLAAACSTTSALELEVGNKESVCNAATEITNGIMDYYLGTRYGGTIGMFQQPYYWWEAGLVFGGMIDTWFICDNDTYVDIITDALLYQQGNKSDYMADNQTHVEANDDQVFWGFTVLEAAERNFPNPPEDQPSWMELAQSVYNSMWLRWDDKCGGGLRWQIFSNMNGWDYKSTISNAGLFAMAGRLARYTDNEIYVLTAERVLAWLKQVSFVQSDQTDSYYQVYDGANVSNNSCGIINGVIWSYNYALLMMGSAYLYNHTESESWKNELDMFLSGAEHYFLNTTSPNVLFEYQCNEWDSCNNDQRAFKAIMSRTLGEIVQLVPEFSDRALTILDASAKGAAESCSGGSDGHTCGMNWAYGGWDGWYGLGEQISALEVIQNTVINQTAAPCSEDTCGTSKSNFTFGLEPDQVPEIRTRTHTQTSLHTKMETVTTSTTSDDWVNMKTLQTVYI